jgi:hypothetical protein
MHQRYVHLIFLILILTGAVTFLSGCERPDPEQPVLTATATVVPATATPIIFPTAAPPQVYVVVVPPSAVEPTATATVDTNTFIVAQQPSPTIMTVPTLAFQDVSQGLNDYYQENYYLGWARSDALTVFRNHVFAGIRGLSLRDQASESGESVGLVIGLSELIVAGRSRCGYTPVLVHATNMMDIVTPRPGIQAPVPLGVLDTPTPLGRLFPEGTTQGWAYSEEMITIGQNAIAGPMGLNIRAEPCQGAKNLGFVPSGADLVVTGRPVDDYTPVLVKNDILQLPFDSPGARELPITATPPGVLGTPDETNPVSKDSDLSSPTPGPTSPSNPVPTSTRSTG